MNIRTKFVFLEKNDSKRLIRLNIYNSQVKKPTFIIEYKNELYFLIRNPYLQAVMGISLQTQKIKSEKY